MDGNCVTLSAWNILCESSMAIYKASLKRPEDAAAAIRDIRSLTDLAISDIRDRLSSGQAVLTWDTDDFPLDMEREDHHRTILEQIRGLTAKGYALRFQYHPAPGDEAEPITFEQLQNLFQSELGYDQQEHD